MKATIKEINPEGNYIFILPDVTGDALKEFRDVLSKNFPKMKFIVTKHKIISIKEQGGK